ncbi:MAG: undecaprenyl-diphosphate phosphatase [Acidobacteria bacterium]|nr:undecaprenyl-diphosphate phosphatase [Acidobacteriota bacterium]
MSLLQVVVLALVQAATEFLPVSSTAHLVLVPWLLGWDDPGLLFDIALHLGTLGAVLVYFARTWVRLIALGLGKQILPPEPGDPDAVIYKNPRLFWFLVAATFPAGIAGLALEDYVESTLRSPVVIGVMLISVGLLIWWAERKGRLNDDLDRMSLRQAMLIGCAQAVALIPGTSRSGITIAAALLLGFRRPAAARFSFLLSSPIIAGASLKAALDVWKEGIPLAMQVPFFIGIVVSAVAGYAVIALFLRYVQRSTMSVFILYRVIFGIIVLALALFFRFPV